jgi:hypothetical protein
MDPNAVVPDLKRPVHGKHWQPARPWPGFVAARRKARLARLDNWTRAMWRGLVGRKPDEEMGVTRAV